jgi:hypothetical protein
MKTSFAFRFFLSAFALVFALYTTAASKVPAANGLDGQLSGIILDGDTHEPIPQANVVLLRASDRSYVATVATRADGSFQFSHLPFGEYTVQTTVLGYQPLHPVFQLDARKPSVKLGEVTLTPLTEPVLKTTPARISTKVGHASSSVLTATQLHTRAWLITRS